MIRISTYELHLSNIEATLDGVGLARNTDHQCKENTRRGYPHFSFLSTRNR